MYKKILKSIEHREYPLPKGPWIMMQKWDHLLFMHWPVSPEIMEARLPPGLKLDTYDGDAWITIIPFKVSAMRLRKMPQLPYLGSFLELNVRTYVKHNGISGIYFFSLDASKLHVVIGARMATLPYFYARMEMKKEDSSFYFSSTRKGNESVAFKGSYQPIGAPFYPEKDSLNHWLMERYFLYTYRSGSLFRGDIHHRRWEIQEAKAKLETQAMTPFLPENVLDTKPILHYARSKRALFWMIKKVKDDDKRLPPENL
ncbi:YqjF family protein [Virgibacillus profundi]|uniref:YqjF family protein n=1 Tax=Virgibacillus profundi TaxID=2024555 RepID=UPI0013FE057E|nr:DUF2071 domain-containing protein [Virgibacillus profundi]